MIFEGEESWYAVSINPMYHDFILKELNRLAWEESFEINFFNPHYIPKRKKSSSSFGINKAFRGSQIYDGYLYIYIDDEELKNHESRIKSIKGVIKVMRPTVTQEEFDAMYDCIMSMYKNYKNPASIKRPVNKSSYEFKGGEMVEIVGGQLTGFRGRVKTICKNGEMLKIGLRLLGTETLVSFPPSMVSLDV